MAKNKIFFNGKGVSIEDITQIEESMNGKTQWYHKGKCTKPRWCFRISQPSEHKCFLTFVEKRDESALMKLIQNHLDPGAQMLSVPDGRSAYGGLSAAGYKHSVVIPKHEHKNSEGYTANSIEWILAQFKGWVNHVHNLRKENYERYMDEFMYMFNFCTIYTHINI